MEISFARDETGEGKERKGDRTRTSGEGGKKLTKKRRDCVVQLRSDFQA